MSSDITLNQPGNFGDLRKLPVMNLIGQLERIDIRFHLPNAFYSLFTRWICEKKNPKVLRNVPSGGPGYLFIAFRFL